MCRCFPSPGEYTKLSAMRRSTSSDRREPRAADQDDAAKQVDVVRCPKASGVSNWHDSDSELLDLGRPVGARKPPCRRRALIVSVQPGPDISSRQLRDF